MQVRPLCIFLNFKSWLEDCFLVKGVSVIKADALLQIMLYQIKESITLAMLIILNSKEITEESIRDEIPLL